MKNWTIRNVPKEVQCKIKEEARNNGLTISNYLCVLFDGEMKSLGHQWTIKGILPGTVKKLVMNARRRNLTVAEYLKSMAEDTKGERAIKAIMDIIEITDGV